MYDLLYNIIILIELFGNLFCLKKKLDSRQNIFNPYTIIIFLKYGVGEYLH